MRDQFLDGKGFDVVTDDLGVPIPAAAGALKGDHATVRPRRKEVRAIATGKQRTIQPHPT